MRVKVVVNIYNIDYPCLCLCFLVKQITLITFLRLITLHFAQIGFTDDRTFMGVFFRVKSELIYAFVSLVSASELVSLLEG